MRDGRSPQWHFHDCRASEFRPWEYSVRCTCPNLSSCPDRSHPLIPCLVEMSTGTGPGSVHRGTEPATCQPGGRRREGCAGRPGRDSLGPPSVTPTPWGVAMLCSGAAGSASASGEGRAGPALVPSTGDPSPCGSLWGFYSCEANIPGAHRASRIISHRRSLSCLMRKR